MSKEIEQITEQKKEPENFSAYVERLRKASLDHAKKQQDQAHEYMRRRKVGWQQLQKELAEYLNTQNKVFEEAPPVSISGGAAPTTQSPEINYASQHKKKFLRRIKRR